LVLHSLSLLNPRILARAKKGCSVMVDMPPLLARKAFGALRPANGPCSAALDALDDKPVRIRITRTTGNVRRNALYWSVLSVVAPILTDKCQGDPITADMLHDILKDRRGLFTETVLPSGQVWKDYRSMSFAKMTEPDRAAFIDWALTTLSTWLDVPVTTLLDEAKADAA
jgi:hypothetical protein